MMYTGVGGVAEWVILGLMVISAVVFAVMDIRKREVENKWLNLYAGFLIVPVVLAYIFDYVPMHGAWIFLYIGISIVVPFLWWFFMKNWIGEADCKWLTITFLALPDLIFLFIGILIIATLVTYAVWRIKGSKEGLMPEMVPISITAIIILIFNIIMGVLTI